MDSNFDQLLKRYLQNKTSKIETARIEELFDSLNKRAVQFITPEGEELLFQEITSTDNVAVELLVDGMYELWKDGNRDFIFHANDL